jgi:hypothetical protein
VYHHGNVPPVTGPRPAAGPDEASRVIPVWELRPVSPSPGVPVQPVIERPVTHRPVTQRPVSPQRPAGPQRLRRSRVPLVLAAILVVLLASAGTLVALNRERLSGRVDVPDVANATADQATTRINLVGLTKSDVRYEDSTTVRPDHVIRTDPPAYRRVRKGTRVVLVLARLRDNAPPATGATPSVPASDTGTPAPNPPPRSGPPPQPEHHSGQPTYCEIPDVTGMAIADAEHTLQGAGLRYAVVHRPGSAPPGVVVQTNPAAGRHEGACPRVTLYVSAPAPDTSPSTSSSPGSGAGGAGSGTAGGAGSGPAGGAGSGPAGAGGSGAPGAAGTTSPGMAGQSSW